MKRVALVLTLVSVISMTMGVCSVGSSETEIFTRDDAVALFEKAIECVDILQFGEPYYSDNEETEYFDYSVYKRGRDFDGYTYFMVNKNHTYGTLDKTMAWAECIFTQDLASEYVKNNIYHQHIGYKGENFLYDDEGNLWKLIYTGLVGLITNYNVLSFRSDGNRAVLTVESRRPLKYPEELVANTVNFVKTDAGWRVAESGYFNYYLDIAPPDGSPETGDVTAARAAVFNAGALLAAVVPALMLTVKHRRKEE